MPLDFSYESAISRHRARSFDQLVGAGEQRRRYFEAQRLGSLQIYDQLEARWLFDWQIKLAAANKNIAAFTIVI